MEEDLAGAGPTTELPGAGGVEDEAPPVTTTPKVVEAVEVAERREPLLAPATVPGPLPPRQSRMLRQLWLPATTERPRQPRVRIAGVVGRVAVAGVVGAGVVVDVAAMQPAPHRMLKKTQCKVRTTMARDPNRCPQPLEAVDAVANLDRVAVAVTLPPRTVPTTKAEPPAAPTTKARARVRIGRPDAAVLASPVFQRAMAVPPVSPETTLTPPPTTRKRTVDAVVVVVVGAAVPGAADVEAAEVDGRDAAVEVGAEVVAVADAAVAWTMPPKTRQIGRAS